ncbi:head-tail connector protein [Ponticoccus sp. (in: a-proteobacteria)]|uniref:head-tail connector protein n=1 Tax=Ponticoccus sp. (in: a-proteobacteria) TaxID=1925025 RepID=UPI003AB69085
MMLVEETPVSDAALPVDALKEHLRMGTGFAGGDLQDGVMLSFLRAALAAIEARTGKALIVRSFLLSMEDWQNRASQRLPIAPVRSVTEVALVDVHGQARLVDPADYRLKPDAFDPALRPMRAALPAAPRGGSVELRFEAGYGEDFTAVPDDLKQAVMLLAAHYYEYRHETALSEGCMPFGVTSLISRYRPVRMGLNG